MSMLKQLLKKGVKDEKDINLAWQKHSIICIALLCLKQIPGYSLVGSS
jgi:hypothetical protein